MVIAPACEIKKLSECLPGTLVRIIGSWHSGKFAIVGSIRGSKDCALVFVCADVPKYVVVNDPAQLQVLAYSSDITIEVDHLGPFEPRARDLYDLAGCIICERNRWIMNVASAARELQFEQKQLDLGTFELCNRSQDIDNIATFGKWSLILEGPQKLRDERVTIMAFERQSPQGHA